MARRTSYPCINCGAPVSVRGRRCRPCWLTKTKQEAAGRTIKRGYAYVAVEGRGWVRENRLVMEQHLGRRLRGTEQVHHANGDTLDNRLENLVLCADNAEHKKYHRRVDRERVLALYATGRGCNAVAAVLGIGETTVYYIVRDAGVLRTQTQAAHLRPRRNGREFAAWA